MEKYYNIIINAYTGYANFLWKEILTPRWDNYFYWVIGASFVIWLAEVFFPWRKNQPKIRTEFWLDLFYTFWNYFLFSLVIYAALSDVFVALFKDFLSLFGIKNLVALHFEDYPAWAKILIVFVVRDFMQYSIHRMYHHVDWMWRFHKVHHSTEEMGFGALMRFHFMENILYRSLEYLPLAMMGFGLQSFFIVHIFTFVTGQLGHANLNLPLGPLRYLLNGPQMHLWHHARNLPDTHPNGFNYGITLSIWDFIFKTNYWPYDDAELPVGLPNEEKIPEGFLKQQMHGFGR